jgi:hypothetical protein
MDAPATSKTNGKHASPRMRLAITAPRPAAADSCLVSLLPYSFETLTHFSSRKQNPNDKEYESDGLDDPNLLL